MTIIACHPESSPRAADVIGMPRTHEFVWFVESDIKLAAMQALDQGRAVAASGSVVPIPALGASLDITIQGAQLLDGDVYAMEFYPEAISESEKAFRVNVLYRPPQVGNLEQPENAGLQPELMKPEVWFEERNTTHPKTRGTLFTYNDSPDTWTESGSTLPLAVASGEPLPPHNVTASYQVMVVEYETIGPMTGRNLSKALNGTCNDSKIKLVNTVGLGSEEPEFVKYELAYIGTRQSRRYNRGWGTWTIQDRYAIHPNLEKRADDKKIGWVEIWPNHGRYVLDRPISDPDALELVPDDGSGTPLPAPYWMKEDGTLATDATPWWERERRYRVLEKEAFHTELSYFEVVT